MGSSFKFSQNLQTMTPKKDLSVKLNFEKKYKSPIKNTKKSLQDRHEESVHHIMLKQQQVRLLNKQYIADGNQSALIDNINALDYFILPVNYKKYQVKKFTS